jgi:hypothetical protein
MTLLEYLMDAPYECGPDDVNMAAFAEATTIIGGRDAVEEFLACGIWPLTEGWEFLVVKQESKVVVPMPKVTATIKNQEMGSDFEARIAATANQLVGNYSIMKHNACVMLQHGWLNRVFELAGMSYQHRLEPIARTTKKMLGYGGGCGGTTSTVENDSQEAEMGKRFIPLGGQDLRERESVG